MKKRLSFYAATASFILLSGFLTSCSVDDAYDLDKDIDLTMGLGSEGLALKLGNTEHVMLGDVLDIDDNELVETDQNNMYYLVKADHTTFDVTVSTASGVMTDVDIDATQDIVSYDDVAEGGALDGQPVTIPGGRTFSHTGVTGVASLEAELNDLPTDINSLRAVYPKSGVFDLRVELFSENPQLDFRLNAVRNLQVTFPDYVRVAGTDANNVFHFSDREGLNAASVSVGTVTLEQLDLGAGPNGLGLEVTTDAQGNRSITLSDDVAMSGDFTVASGREQTFGEGDAVKLRLVVSLEGGGRLEADRITGEVNPDVEPEIDPVEVGDELPDFLTDGSVTLTVQNPTLRFQFDATDLPVPVEFSSHLTSLDAEGQTLASADLPQQGRNDVDAGSTTVYYYSQTGSPYDPDGVTAGARSETVSNLAALVYKIPDQIDVDCSNGRVGVKQGVLHDIRLGHTYSAAVDYEVLVPFQFNAGTTIVYNDSVVDMNDDIKDYQAAGVEITADAINFVPMVLEVTAEPYDVAGRLIPELSISTARVAAAQGNEGTTTPIVLTLEASDPAAVSRLDQLRFRVTAVSEAEGELRSDQYFYFDNLRLRLKGQVVGDFN